MTTEQFERLLAEFREIKALLVGKVGQKATVSDHAAPQPVLRWFKSCFGDHWWAGPVVDDFTVAVYCTREAQFYKNGGSYYARLVDEDAAKDVPLAFSVGVIFAHAAANGIHVEPFPWHQLGEKE